LLIYYNNEVNIIYKGGIVMQDELIEGLWYPIPGFNGYTINNYGVVKSMKNFKAYPEGIFIQPKVDKHQQRYYILSDDRNERKKMYAHELISLAINSAARPLKDNEICLGGRNRGYANYQKKHPNNKGTIKIDIREGTTIIPRKEKEEIKLSFSSFDKFKEEEKKKPEPIVIFY
jgi:hypothetical protein